MDGSFDTNVEHVKKMLDFQKDLTEQVDARKKILQQIDHLDTSAASRINKQMGDSERHAQKYNTLYKDLQVTMQEFAQTLETDINKTSRRNAIESIKEEIAWTKDKFEVSRLEWEIALKELEKIKQRHDFINGAIISRLGLELKEITLIQKTTDELSSMFGGLSRGQAGALSAILVITAFARSMYDSFEKSAWSFRKSAGIFREEAKHIRRTAEYIAVDFAQVGMTIDDAYKSFKNLGTEMGGFYNASRDLVLTTSLLSVQIGVAEEHSVGLLRNLAVVSKGTMQSQKYAALFAAELANAAGVPVDTVMADVAKMSGSTFSLMSKLPSVIIKSTVEARRLNTSINDIARASESILDFQSSVNAEMEASVLLGSAINLQRARELAYRGQIVESTKEILNIAKKIDFQNLDYFQMQSFARATGRSVDELNKMLQAETEIANAKLSTDPAIQRQLKAYEQMKSYNEDMALTSGKNLEHQLQSRANQERMVMLQNQWNKLLMQASEMFLPIIDLGLTLTGVLVSALPILLSIGGAIKGIGMLIGRVGDKIAVISRVTNSWILFGNKMATIGGTVLNIFGKFGGFLGAFGKFIPILGWVITAFQIVSSSIRNISAFLRGEVGFGTALFGILDDVLLKPFKQAWEWIKSIFIGRSPSELAMGIVRGIISVQSMIYDALTYPFRKAWSWISGTPSPTLFSATPQTADQSISGGSVASTTTSRDKSESDSAANKTLNDILIAIKTLNSNLESGKIGVYVDGSLVSSTLARKLEFKGAFGMNT